MKADNRNEVKEQKKVIKKLKADGKEDPAMVVIAKLKRSQLKEAAKARLAEVLVRFIAR